MPDFDRPALERMRDHLRAVLSLVECQLAEPVDNPFLTWQRAAPLMGMTPDAAKKRAQREGEKLNGKLGFRRSYIAIYRESMGWPRL